MSGAKPGHGACHFPERFVVIREMTAAGATQQEIADQLGMTVSGLAQFQDRWGGMEPRPTKPRRCLLCRAEFPSHGPGNRLCDGCVGADVYAVEHSVARHV